jgi:ring-1,2-phenylacetyl-CoA epoxidase subunit PaaE
VELKKIRTELFHVDGTAPRQVVTRTDSSDPGSASTVTIVLDGRASTFPLAAEAEPILDATLKIRADAPYACKGGVCGTCRAKVVVGEVVMERCYALDPEEVEKGYVLACQSHPVTDEVTLNFDV